MLQVCNESCCTLLAHFLSPGVRLFKAQGEIRGHHSQGLLLCARHSWLSPQIRTPSRAAIRWREKHAGSQTFTHTQMLEASTDSHTFTHTHTQIRAPLRTHTYTLTDTASHSFHTEAETRTLAHPRAHTHAHKHIRTHSCRCAPTHTQGAARTHTHAGGFTQPKEGSKKEALVPAMCVAFMDATLASGLGKPIAHLHTHTRN